MSYDFDAAAHKAKHYLTPKQHLIVLRNIRESIARGDPLTGFDSDSVGDKDTACSWGMCSDRADHYPFRSMHIFPSEFRRSGRTSPKEPSLKGDGWEQRLCPFRDPESKDSPGTKSGCFYHCRFFQARRLGGVPTQEKALAWYDAAIKELREELGSRAKDIARE